jgi:hypothetical protein
MWSIKSHVNKKIRSKSTNRLIRNPEIDSKKFFYLGETPERKTKIFNDNTNHQIKLFDQQLQFIGNDLSNNQLIKRITEPANKFRPISRKKKSILIYDKINSKKDMIKNKSVNEINSKNKAELYIEHLISVPIAQRKTTDRNSKGHSPSHYPNPISKIQFISPIKKKTENYVNIKSTPIVLDKPDHLIMYCEPLTIDDTESPSPPFKPRYL